jgi:hypothetical protein
MEMKIFTSLMIGRSCHEGMNPPFWMFSSMLSAVHLISSMVPGSCFSSRATQILAAAIDERSSGKHGWNETIQKGGVCCEKGGVGQKDRWCVDRPKKINQSCS